MIKKLFVIILGLFLFIGTINGQNNLCEAADPFCSGQNYTFPAGVNAGTAQAGPDYGCLFTQPNPAWYYMQVDQSGNITINMQSAPLVDIDFICYGPFNSLTGACNNLTAGNTVDCSYSSAAIETCVIPNATTGQFYLLLITNFSNAVCDISFSQTNFNQPGAGSTDCSIVAPAVGNNGPICEGDTLELYSATIINAVSYNWYGPNGFTASSQNVTIPNATMQHYGQYMLIVSDGFDEDTTYTTVQINQVPEVSFVANNICDSTYALFNSTVILDSGFVATYDWTFGIPPVGTSTVADPTFLFPGPGTYPVGLIVATDRGCVDTAIGIINIYPKPQAMFNATLLESCNPLCPGLTDGSTIGQPSTINSWQWYIDNQSFSTTQNPAECILQPGQYDVTLIVTSEKGCKDTMRVLNLLTSHGIPSAEFFVDDEIPNTVISIPFISNTNFAVSWQWDFGDGNTSTLQNPYHEYADTGRYCVTLIATSAFGCADTSTACLYYYQDFFLYIPNAFTPNADGLNDVFQIIGGGIVEMDMRIFNRWGQEIFYTDKADGGWNGMLNNNTVFSPQGVYSYRIEAKDIYGEDHLLLGKVTLMK